MDRWKVFPLSSLLAIVLVLVGCSSADAGKMKEGGEVTITVASGFPKNHGNNDGLWIFLEELEKNAPWITIDYKGGPEVMAPNLLIEGVSGGIFDIGMLPGDYYVDQIPAMEIARFTPYTPMEERERGIVEIYDEIHREQLGITYLGRAAAGMPQLVLTRRELEGLNFHGEAYRTSSATSDIIHRLNGVPVDLPGNEVYAALERNVVSGVTWAAVGPSSLGVDEVVEYHMAPRFYESLANLVMNERSWEQLDMRTQKAISDTIAEVEGDIYAHYLKTTIEETRSWEEKGVKELPMSEEDSLALIELAYGEVWDELDWERILEASPAAAQLREAYDVPVEDLSRVPSGASVRDTEELLEALA